MQRCFCSQAPAKRENRPFLPSLAWLVQKRGALRTVQRRKTAVRYLCSLPIDFSHSMDEMERATNHVALALTGHGFRRPGGLMRAWLPIEENQSRPKSTCGTHSSSPPTPPLYPLILPPQRLILLRSSHSHRASSPSPNLPPPPCWWKSGPKGGRRHNSPLSSLPSFA
jgi:hypothetical protein